MHFLHPGWTSGKRALLLLQLQLCTACIPGGRVACRERLHGRFFHNVECFFLWRRRVPIFQRRSSLLGLLRHNSPHSTASRIRSDMPYTAASRLAARSSGYVSFIRKTHPAAVKYTRSTAGDTAFLPVRLLSYADACWLRWRNASKSALIWSALVVGMPCGKPG
jgi:hypothetical protein